MRYKKLSDKKIVAWIEQNFEYKTRRDGEEYLINNPFDGDTGFHFNISPDKGICNDWRGNEWVGVNPKTGKRNKCSFLKFVQLYLNCSYTNALRAVLGATEDIGSYLRPRSQDDAVEAKEEPSVCLPDGSERLVGSKDVKVAKIIVNWLAQRGLSEEDIKLYDIHHRGLEVVWPYYEYDELVYWQSRSRINKMFMFPDSSVGVSKGDFLYGFDLIEPASYLTITEAIFDAHTLGDQTVASGGAALTKNQIKKIRLLGPKDGVVLAPDNDKAGIKSIFSNYKLLNSNNLKVYYSLPPEIEFTKNGEKGVAKDWNELHTHVGMNHREILQSFENNIKAINQRELVRLRSEVSR